MADKTANYKLVKPDENDFYDINVFNDNADVLDKEIHKLDVPEFEDYTGEEAVVPSAEEALQSMVKGKKLMELLGSMKAFCKGVITIGKLANRFDVVEEGYALDARAGKTLFDQVAQLNSDISTKIYPVGSIYITVNEENPSTIFGGEWQLLPDRFLIGAGGSYTVGSTGGRNTAALDTYNLPIEAAVRTNNQAHSAYTGGTNAANGTWSMHRMSDDAKYSNNYSRPFSVLNPYLAVYIWKRID